MGAKRYPNSDKKKKTKHYSVVWMRQAPSSSGQRVMVPGRTGVGFAGENVSGSGFNAGSRGLGSDESDVGALGANRVVFIPEGDGIQFQDQEPVYLLPIGTRCIYKYVIP
jgi:hypothetical protein